MKPRKSFSTYSSFQDLKALLKTQTIFPPYYHKRKAAQSEIKLSPEMEEKLFLESMEGVIPIPREHGVERIFHIRRPEVRPAEDSEKREEAEALSQLTSLVKNGAGFNILDTPEYIEGTGYNVPSEVARRLHRGDYSIQAHVDLHRMSAQVAKEVFERFLRWTVITGKTGVLIIHGRGFSSASEPVLKNKVIEWLTRGPWRKWVIAYSSARSCDGGAGATYILLRQRPVSKRLKRPPEKQKDI
jgi:DNA-nicking Smr family endonuclease